MHTIFVPFLESGSASSLQFLISNTFKPSSFFVIFSKFLFLEIFVSSARSSMESGRDRAPKRNALANACIFSKQSNPFFPRRTHGGRPNWKLGPTKDRNSTRKSMTSACFCRSRKNPLTEPLMITSAERLGPDPDHLPKKVFGLLLKSSSDEERRLMGGIEEWFSGSVCAQSPPPCSLPLPNFMKRPEGSCNGEAGGGIDILATQNLRCLLGL